MPSCCHWPPDGSCSPMMRPSGVAAPRGRPASRLSMPRSWAMRATSSGRSRSRCQSPKAMFSAAVASNRVGTCESMPISRRRSSRATRRRSTPSKRTSPRSGSSTPARMRATVVLPAPFSPTSATVSPRRRVKGDTVDRRPARSRIGVGYVAELDLAYASARQSFGRFASRWLGGEEGAEVGDVEGILERGVERVEGEGERVAQPRRGASEHGQAAERGAAGERVARHAQEDAEQCHAGQHGEDERATELASLVAALDVADAGEQLAVACRQQGREAQQVDLGRESAHR
jgi:hypothetical protein